MDNFYQEYLWKDLIQILDAKKLDREVETVAVSAVFMREADRIIRIRNFMKMLTLTPITMSI